MQSLNRPSLQALKSCRLARLWPDEVAANESQARGACVTSKRDFQRRHVDLGGEVFHFALELLDPAPDAAEFFCSDGWGNIAIISLTTLTAVER